MRIRRIHILAFPLLLLIAAAGCATDDAPEAASMVDPDEAEETMADNSACPSLIGSWELVSISSNSPALSQEFELDPDYEEAPTLKVINETHWMFIRQTSDRFIHSQGGTYTLENGKYTEHVEYSAQPQNIGVEYGFDCRLEGDSLWHHVGGLGDNRYDELWRRVE